MTYIDWKVTEEEIGVANPLKWMVVDADHPDRPLTYPGHIAYQ
jgi:hypothetical protein